MKKCLVALTIALSAFATAAGSGGAETAERALILGHSGVQLAWQSTASGASSAVQRALLSAASASSVVAPPRLHAPTSTGVTGVHAVMTSRTVAEPTPGQ